MNRSTSIERKIFVLKFLGTVQAAELSIESGANVNAMDDAGDTPLIFAAYKSKSKISEEKSW